MTQKFDTPLYTSDQSIDRVLGAGMPVLLVSADTTASTALAGALKSLASSEAGNLLVVQIDPKDSPQTAARFRLSAAPALAAIKDGQVISQAERISSTDVLAHARYLLGKGPRPAAAQASAPYQSAQPAGSSPRPQSDGGTAAGHPVTVTDATFDQEVLRANVPVVVDFWAPWCGPCRMVAPVLDKLAREWAGRVKIVKVNVDENPYVSGRYGIRSIPTMMVVKNGQIADQWAGALPEPQMRSRLSRAI